MTKRALVLAGGGIAGIAWETGILRGIADESPDAARRLLNSDVVLGTSAGSVVAAQICTGVELGRLHDRHLAQDTHELHPGVDFDELNEMFMAALGQPELSPDEVRRRIGEIAVTARTLSEAQRRGVIEKRLPVHDWPDRDLRITAVETRTGELTAFTRSSGVALVDAVAASCAVPGCWPPVTIGDRRYMDGGVASSINLAIADDCEIAVILIPAAESEPAALGPGVAAEISDFPGRALAIFADEESIEAFGTDRLDPKCSAPAVTAGRDQGRRIAAMVADFL